ncbi:MAG TPA: DUF6114 domain-containing protein [Streptosporangiaceae bacterium]
MADLAPELPRRIWSEFTSWRRGRPFWAGLIMAAAGAELLLLPLPIHAMGLILHIGTGGVLGILIGAILIACALLLWFSPAQKTFYSIVAVLLAVAALVASNLGGFLIGTILGVLGGSLAFAWTPDAPGQASRSAGSGLPGGWWRHRMGPPRHQRDRNESAFASAAEPPSRAFPADQPEDPFWPDLGVQDTGGHGRSVHDTGGHDDGGRDDGGRDDADIWSDVDGGPNATRFHGGLPILLTVPILPTVLAALLALLHISAVAAGPDPATSPSPALCKSLASLPSGEPSLIASAAKEIAVACTSLGLDPSSTSSPATSSNPGASGTGGGIGLGPHPLPSPSISLGLKPSPGASPGPSIGASSGPNIKIASKASNPGVTVSSVPATLTAKSATIKGFAYDGQVTVRLPDGTVEQMMRFTMTSLDLSGIDLTAGQGRTAVTTKAPAISLSGSVVLYATALSGFLYGDVPITLTPASPVSAVLRALSGLTKKVPVQMTNVVADQPYTSGKSMSIQGLDIS